MKNIIINFFSKQYFIELKVLFIIEILMISLLFLLYTTNNMISNLNYFNLNAFLISLFISITCCLIDHKKYFNLASLMATGFYTYICFWVILTFIK